MRRPQRWIVLLVLFLAACSSNTGDEEWGAAAEEFFAEWSDAWASSDSYDIIRFYDVDVAVGLAQDYRSLSLNAGYVGTSVSGAGRAWLVNWIEAQYEPRDRSLGGVYVGNESAAVLVKIDEINGAAAVTMSVNGETISAYTDLRWRDAHLDGGQPDGRLDWLDDLVDEHVAGLAGLPADVTSNLYMPNATVEAFPVAAVAAGSAPVFAQAEVATIDSGDRDGRGVFVGVEQAAYVVDTTDSDGCDGQYMINLILEEGRILREVRMPTADTVRRCYSDGMRPTGWWSEIVAPLPVGEQKTGIIAERDGTEISIFNGTPELEQLLVWGLERFEGAGLNRPEILTASFAPLPVCDNIPGVVTDSIDGGADLVLCTDAYRACVPDRDDCTGFTTGDRLGMLHELGHAWLLTNLSPEAQNEFLDVLGLDSWADGAAPWHERGAEQAAEIIAWGLMDEDIRLVRIGEPSCSLAATAFAVLTGSVPPRDCG